MSGYAEGARAGDPRAAEILAALLRADRFDEVGGEQHAACIEDDRDKSACIDDAIGAGLFPTYRQWADEVDAISAGKGSATCAEAPRGQLLDDRDFDTRPPPPSR
jgi:hypothetical protein